MDSMESTISTDTRNEMFFTMRASLQIKRTLPVLQMSGHNFIRHVVHASPPRGRCETIYNVKIDGALALMLR
jgi:hypothetical protein